MAESLEGFCLPSQKPSKMCCCLIFFYFFYSKLVSYSKCVTTLVGPLQTHQHLINSLEGKLGCLRVSEQICSFEQYLESIYISKMSSNDFTDARKASAVSTSFWVLLLMQKPWEEQHHFPSSWNQRKTVAGGFSAGLAPNSPFRSAEWPHLPPKSRQGEDAQPLCWINSLVSKATVLGKDLMRRWGQPRGPLNRQGNAELTEMIVLFKGKGQAGGLDGQ